MQAVKALYKQGHIELLAPLQGITEAELFVIVLDKTEQTGDVFSSFRPINLNSEQDFKAIGLSSFFDTNEDNNVDWEDMFHVERR